MGSYVLPSRFVRHVILIYTMFLFFRGSRPLYMNASIGPLTFTMFFFAECSYILFVELRGGRFIEAKMSSTSHEISALKCLIIGSLIILLPSFIVCFTSILQPPIVSLLRLAQLLDLRSTKDNGRQKHVFPPLLLRSYCFVCLTTSANAPASFFI